MGKESDIALLSWVVGERGVEILLRSVPNMQWRFVGPSVVLVLGWVVRRGYKGKFGRIPVRQNTCSKSWFGIEWLDQLLMHICRRVPPRAPWSGSPDVDFKLHVFKTPGYAIHTHDVNSGYIHP